MESFGVTFADLIRKPKSARVLLVNAAKDGKFTDNTVRKKAQEIFQVVGNLLRVTEYNVDLDDSQQSCSRVVQPVIDTLFDDVELSDILEAIDYPPTPTLTKFVNALKVMRKQLGMLRGKLDRLYLQGHHQRQERLRERFLTDDEQVIIDQRRADFFSMLMAHSWMRMPESGRWQCDGWPWSSAFTPAWNSRFVCSLGWVCAIGTLTTGPSRRRCNVQTST
jgi:hypothetical protein